MKLIIAVCEDESIPLKINCTYIEELSKKYRIEANIIGFTSGEAILEYRNKEEIDIVFMDIDLKGLNGIQTASILLKKNPRIITIFITGHKEFAYDAFNVEAFSFIIKPVDPERLERIFKKAVLLVNDFNNRKQRSPFIITEDNLKKKINQASIMYIERIDTQSVIVTKSSKHYVYETITSLLERLEDHFIRINQGIIVNLTEVAQLNKNTLQMKTGDEFPIGRTYAKEVKRRYLDSPQI